MMLSKIFSKTFSKQNGSLLSRQSKQLFSTGDKKKVVCALYAGGEAGKNNTDILGCDTNKLGLEEFLKERGVEFVVTTDKDDDYDNDGKIIRESEFSKELKNADIVISQPFYPGYITPERIKNSPKLKLAITAGVGSDHVALKSSYDRGIIVTEVRGSNVVSVAEHVVMQILSLVRNYIPAYKQVINGEWDIAAIADRSWDLEGKTIGTVAAGAIGYRVLKRLEPFDVNLCYTDIVRMPNIEKEIYNLKWHDKLENMLPECDVVTINCPLTTETDNLFDRKMIEKCKPGAFIVNTARGKIVNAQAMADAVDSGYIGGYAGDVWFPQPAPRNHPWRLMPRHGLTPHISGTSLDAQKRYAAGVKEILECFLDGKEIRKEFTIINSDNNFVAPEYGKKEVLKDTTPIFGKQSSKLY